MDEKSLMEEILGIRSKKNRGELLFDDKNEENEKNFQNNSDFKDVKSENSEKKFEENLKQKNLEKENQKNKIIKIKRKKFFSKKEKNSKIIEFNDKKNKKEQKENEKAELLGKAKKMLKIAQNIKSQKKFFAPFIHTEDTTQKVMLDFIISLIPTILVTIFIFRLKAFFMILISILTMVITEKIITFIFLKNQKNSIKDLSAIVTGILFALILPIQIPYYYVIFGAIFTIIFGKMIFGGLGKNLYNSVIIGKIFILTIFFSETTSIFFQKNSKILNFKLFQNFLNVPILNFLDNLIFETSNSIGTYSSFTIILGLIYLVIKKRITLHIPLINFFILLILSLFVPNIAQIPIGKILFFGIFLATDMPTSPIFSSGKIYFGLMLAIITTIFVSQKIYDQSLIYSIIVLNSFTPKINKIFRPIVFGKNIKFEIIKQFFGMIILTILIMILVIIFIILHNFDLIKYLVFVYVIILIFKVIIFYKRN